MSKSTNSESITKRWYKTEELVINTVQKINPLKSNKTLNNLSGLNCLSRHKFNSQTCIQHDVFSTTRNHSWCEIPNKNQAHIQVLLKIRQIQNPKKIEKFEADIFYKNLVKALRSKQCKKL